ncbi:hypothetical protein ABPG75_002954 [Micractinium tetrahymenae]
MTLCSHFILPLALASPYLPSAPPRRATCSQPASLSQHWNKKTDLEPCTWVDKNALGQTVRELNFTLGINVPFQFASRVGEIPCPPGTSHGAEVRCGGSMAQAGYLLYPKAIAPPGHLPAGGRGEPQLQTHLSRACACF